MPNWSVPMPSAVQAFAPAAIVNVQVKSVEAPGARVAAPPPNKPVHLPPPVTDTPVSEAVPVFFSVTTMVAVLPTGAFEPSAGVELFKVN